MQTTV